MQSKGASELERLAAWMIEHSFSTGHGDTFEDLLKELDWQVKELRGARLEEAKWWNGLQEHERHHSLVSLTCSADKIPTIEACARLGCKMCERLAALAQALQPATGDK